MPSKSSKTSKPEAKPRFMTLGSSKFVHVVRPKKMDLKVGAGGSECQQVRKFQVAGKIKPSDKGVSAEAALSMDGCERCGTHVVAERFVDPEVKKAKRKDDRDDVLDRAKTGRAKGEAPKGKSKSGPKKGKAVGGEFPVVKSKPKSGPTKTKAGVRSTGSDTEGKANALRDFAVEAGWKVEYKDGDPGLLLVAAKGDATINCWFIDGKYDIGRHAYIEVGSWKGTLRGAHACRRQMAGDSPVHPNPGKGRSGPRKGKTVEVPEDESPEDAARRVPFSLDAPEVEVIDAIKGKVIHWRNSTSGLIEEGWLPAAVHSKGKDKSRALIAITTHPKTERRMVTFMVVDSVNEHGEVYGPERTVYLDKIVKVAG